MAITRAKQSSLRTGVTKYDNLRAGLPFTPTIGTATDGGTGTTVSVTFTGNNTAGLTYTALSTPGSLSATGTTSPITVTGLTSGTAYTFAVKATNSAGDSPYSAASNSVTPATPSSYESIATATATGSSSTITFSSIPSGYVSLQIRANYANASGDLDSMQLNGDTTSNYTMHRLRGDGASATAQGSAPRANMVLDQYSVNGTTYSSIRSALIVDIHDYTSTSKYKTIRTFNGYNTNTTDGWIGLNSGLWMSTSAVTSITILNSGASNYISGSTFSLYGIKG
jgi:hypothetical protein